MKADNFRNAKINYGLLHQFSLNRPKNTLTSTEQKLHQKLELFRKEINFPAVKDDVGHFLSLLVKLCKPNVIFEFGSGYGQSCFWYFVGNPDIPQKVYLTEIRPELNHMYESLEWPQSWKEKINYFGHDAFEILDQLDEKIDFLFMDGKKSDYLEFLKKARSKLSKNAVVVIDNAFWKGSFLDQDLLNKKSVRAVRELHDQLDSLPFNSTFIPFCDGILLMSPN